MKINCLIIDDEPLALDILENYIQRVPALNLVKRCNNALEAMDEINKQKIDLMFCDIEMPELSGIDFLKTLKTKPLVIFTTAFPNYAIEGYSLDVIDYLLKPISFERFLKAVNKASDYLSLMQKEEGAEDQEDYIFIKSEQKFIKMRIEDILYIEALADYVRIHSSEKRVVTLQTMKNLEDRLPGAKFARVHRSFIVAINKINAISGNQIEIGKEQIPIGKNFREEFFNMVQQKNLFGNGK